MNLWGIIKGLLIHEDADKSKQLAVEIDPASTTNTRTTLKAAQTANRTVMLPDASDTLMGKDTVDVITNKSYDADGPGNVLTNIEDENIKVGAAINVEKLADGSVDNAEFQRLDGVTSNIQDQLDANAQAIADHIADPSDAHDASAISNIPTGNLAATDVQGALDELQADIDTRALDADLDAHINDATDAHDASAISNIPAGNLAATDIQGAVNELQSDIDTRALDTDLQNHINDATDAHDASAISVVPAGNLSSTQVQAALEELQADIDVLSPSGGANTALSNLIATSINQDLIPDAMANNRNLGRSGNSATNPKWAGLFLQNTGTAITIQSNNLSETLRIANAISLPNLGISGVGLLSPLTDTIVVGSANRTLQNSGGFGVETGNYNGTTLGQRSGKIDLRTGNATAADGGTGDITLQTGTIISGGTRGKVQIVDGSEGTTGHVLTSTDVNGRGSWAAPVTTGLSSVRGLRGSTVSTSEISVIADHVVLRNSLNQIVINNPSGLITNNIATAGPVANGRDQAGAFSTGWVNLFYIWNGTTLATVSSTASHITGPTLPSGYTHWAFIGSYYHTSGTLRAIDIQGSWVYNMAIQPVLSNGSSSGATISLLDYIPAACTQFEIQYILNIVSTAGGLASAQVDIYTRVSNLLTRYNGDLSGLAASTTTSLLVGSTILGPNPALDPTTTREMRYGVAVSSGTSPGLTLRMTGYKVSNGDT